VAANIFTPTAGVIALPKSQLDLRGHFEAGQEKRWGKGRREKKRERRKGADPPHPGINFC